MKFGFGRLISPDVNTRFVGNVTVFSLLDLDLVDQLRQESCVFFQSECGRSAVSTHQHTAALIGCSYL